MLTGAGACGPCARALMCVGSRRSALAYRVDEAERVADLGEGPDLRVSRGVAEEEAFPRLEEDEIAGDPIALEAVRPCADHLAGAIGKIGLAGALGDRERIVLGQLHLAVIGHVDVDEICACLLYTSPSP